MKQLKVSWSEVIWIMVVSFNLGGQSVLTIHEYNGLNLCIFI